MSKLFFLLFFLAPVCLKSLYVNAKWIRRDYRQPLTAAMVYEGKVDKVRTILYGRLENENLARFLHIVRMFNRNTTPAEIIKAIKEMFVIVLASNSNTTESDWLKITSGDKSVWTQNEIREVISDLPKVKPTGDKWRMLKKAIKLRMNEENANRIGNILNKMREGATLYQHSDGLSDLMKMTVAALANKSGDEIQKWIC